MKYNVSIKRVSGRLNESALPSKNLVINSKTKKSAREVLAEASKYYKKKYGLVIESADVATISEAAKPQQRAIGYSVLRHKIEERPARSAWSRGVKEYALEMVDHLEEYNDGDIPHTMENLNAWLLNGARDWKQASEGGSWLITNEEIAQRLCSPAELKKVAGGRRQPNKRETWIDVQARALHQAAQIVKELGSRTVAFR